MKRTILALSLALLAAACGDGGDAADAPVDSTSLNETPEALAELLVPVREVSVAIVELSDVALQKAEDGDVRSYASVVTTDHRALVQAIDSVARARGATITQTPAAQELENSVRMAHAGISELEGETYDLSYIRAQVETHRRVLDRIEMDLLPAATSADIQQFLRDIQAAEEAHLTRARQILAALLGESAEPEPETPAGQGTTPTGPADIPPSGG